MPAADSNGTSDPFIVVHDSDKLKRTATIEDNLNPIFYEALDLIYEANSIEEMPPFVIDCMDEDPALLGGKPTSEFLNRAVIPVSGIKFSEGDTIIKPTWYPLKLTNTAPPSGEILLSFAIVSDDFSFKKTLKNVRLDKEVQMEEFQVSLNVLGLRSL